MVRFVLEAGIMIAHRTVPQDRIFSTTGEVSHGLGRSGKNEYGKKGHMMRARELDLYKDDGNLQSSPPSRMVWLRPRALPFREGGRAPSRSPREGLLAASESTDQFRVLA
jgi:hypothetical protein